MDKKVNNRTSREAVTREETEVRNRQWEPRSTLPEVKHEAGWAYRWVRVSLVNEAQYKLGQAQDRKPQYTKESLQTSENAVSSEQDTVRPTVPQPDAKALAWQEKNKWFGQDEEMTSLALGLHEKLVRNGVNPSSDEYYRSIDSTMQKRFPENFGGTDTLEEAKPAQRKPSTVVAPATRSTGPKKVRLTKTQLALAKKFKLTPEQYARELIKTESTNG